VVRGGECGRPEEQSPLLEKRKEGASERVLSRRRTGSLNGKGQRKKNPTILQMTHLRGCAEPHFLEDDVNKRNTEAPARTEGICKQERKMEYGPDTFTRGAANGMEVEKSQFGGAPGGRGRSVLNLKCFLYLGKRWRPRRFRLDSQGKSNQLKEKITITSLRLLRRRGGGWCD